MRVKEKEVQGCVQQRLLHEQPGVDAQQIEQQSKMEANLLKHQLNVVRMGFMATLRDPSTGHTFVTPVTYSTTIYNAQKPDYTILRIAEVDKTSGSCLGGDTIWLRCAEKVKKDFIKIIFFESETNWQDEGVFQSCDVHGQILVIFKTPPYRDRSIRFPVTVLMYLFRTNDQQRSEPVQFVYLPVAEDNGPSAKRARLVPAFGMDSSLGFLFPNGQSGSSYSAAPHEMQAYMPAPPPYSQIRQGRAPEVRPDSGIADVVEDVTSPTSTAADVSKMQQFSIAEMNAETMQQALSKLWMSQLHAIYDFAVDGDPALLLAHSKRLVGVQDENGDSALHLAARHGQPSVLKTLIGLFENQTDRLAALNAQNVHGYTPLSLAVRYSHTDCAHYLIAAGTDRSLLDKKGNSLFHLLGLTIQTCPQEICQDILTPPVQSNPPDLNLLNHDGYSALHLACKAHNVPLLELLLEAHASLELKDRSMGRTALHFAVEAESEEMVLKLIYAGSSVNVQCHDGTTPLHLAVQSNHLNIAHLLISNGADPSLSQQIDAPPSELEEDVPDEIEGEEGARAAPLSAMDMARNNEEMLKVLRGEAAPPSTSTAAGAFGGFGDSAGTSSRPGNFKIGVWNEGVEAPIDTSDEMSSLDFVTRVRLSKLLDNSGWRGVAAALGCEHMVEYLSAVDDSSPTLLLLDQYEQIPSSSLSALMRALDEAGYGSAVEMIVQESTRRRGPATEETDYWD